MKKNKIYHNVYLFSDDLNQYIKKIWDFEWAIFKWTWFFTSEFVFYINNICQCALIASMNVETLKNHVFKYNSNIHTVNWNIFHCLIFFKW